MAKTLMNAEDFNKFFDAALSAAHGTRGASVTMMDVLKEHGLEPKFPASVNPNLVAMLNQPVGEIRSIPHNCSWCGTCSLCAACGELNAAALGANSAHAVHILD